MPTTRTNKTLAWRNAWDVPETDGEDQGCAARARQCASARKCIRNCRRTVLRDRPVPAHLPANRGRRRCARTSRASSSGRPSTPTSWRRSRNSGPETLGTLSTRSDGAEAGSAQARCLGVLDTILRFMSSSSRSPFSGCSPSPSSSAGSSRSIPCWPSSATARRQAWSRRRARSMGFDLPLYEQFLLYVKNALTGDFGTSVLTDQSGHAGHPPRLSGDAGTRDARHAHRRVTRRSARRAGRSASAAAWSTRSCASSVSIGYSVPIFWLGLLALLVFYARLGWVGGSRPHRRGLRIHVHADHRLLPA